MKRFVRPLLLAVMAAAPPAALATGEGEAYVEIYGLILEGKDKQDAGMRDEAVEAWEEARRKLLAFRGRFPSWNPEVIGFRLRYLDERLPERPARMAEAGPQMAPAQLPVQEPDAEILQGQLTASGEQIRQLIADNQLLVAKLREALSARPADIDPAEVRKAESRIRDLEKQQSLLEWRLESEGDRSRPGAGTGEAAADRILRLEEENSELKRQLDEAGSRAGKLERENSQLRRRQEQDGGGRRGFFSLGRRESRQLRDLKARLAVFEAEKVPWDEDELALVRTMEESPASPAPAPRSAQPLPLRSQQQEDQARGAFGEGDLERASGLCREILEEHPGHVPVLLLLARIRIQQEQLQEAGVLLERAQEAGPESAEAIYLGGMLRFHQKKLDEAISWLSRAIALDPSDAACQNLLGMALTEAGHAEAAETALRKAIRLQPDFAEAHANLAIVYAAQDPPYAQLAQFHYQKAIQAGHAAVPQLERMLGE